MRIDPSRTLTETLRSLLYLPAYAQHAQDLQPRTVAARAAAQQMLALQPLEKLVDAHSVAFGYPPSRLHKIVIEPLKEHLSQAIAQFLETEPEPRQTFKKLLSAYASGIRNLLSSIRDRRGYVLRLIGERQAIALLLEQLGDVRRALQIRMTTDQAIYTEENAFGLCRLLRRSGLNEKADKIPFKSADEVKLAEGWRTAFAKSTDSTRPVETGGAAELRQMAECPNITLQLAVGLLRLGEEDRHAARRHFHEALVLRQQAKWSTIDHQGWQDIKYDPWSMGFAEAFVLAQRGQHLDGMSIFPPPDALRLSRLNATFLRSEGSLLSALRFYGAILYPGSGNIPPRHVIYRAYWIAYYRDRWVAVPQSRMLKWVLQPVWAPGYLPAVHPATRSAGIDRLKRILSDGLSAAHRLSQRSPFYPFMLKIVLRLRHVTFLRFGSFFGVIFGSDLSKIKERIDARSR